VAALKERLSVALASAVKQLDEADIPYALVGGLAVGVRADPRVTRDIDFVVPVAGDDEAEARVFALQQRGFMVQSVFVRRGGRISTVRTRHRSAPEIFIDLLFSNARIESEIVAEATSENVTRQIRCRVAQPWHLIAMKVYANRPKDQLDLQELVVRADRATLDRARKALALMAERGVAGRRDLIRELERLVHRVRSTGYEHASKSSRTRRIMRRNPRG
jgi:hypothetical protein